MCVYWVVVVVVVALSPAIGYKTTTVSTKTTAKKNTYIRICFGIFFFLYTLSQYFYGSVFF